MKLISLTPNPYSKWVLILLMMLLYITTNAQTYTKTGTVYEDYNASKSFNAGEPATNAGGLLWVYLINNTSNVVLQSQAVSTSGTYSFTVTALSGASYIIGIGSAGIAVGTVFTGGTTAYNSFLTIPAGWSNVAPADSKWKTAGNGTNSTTNFFIRKLPTASNVQSQVFACNPTGCVSIPALAGVAAVGNTAYTIENYQVIAVPAGGTLKAGSNTITAGEVITAVAATTLCFQKTAGYAGNVTFTYVAIDDAGNNDYLSNVATYTIRLGGVAFRRDGPSSILLTCNSQPATLFAPFTSDTTGSAFTYSWTGPNGFTSTQKTPVLAANAAVEDGLYVVTATDQNGCPSKDTLKTKKMNCYASCDGDNAYMVKGSGSTNADRLYKYTLSTGVTTTISSTLTSMDAVCYNIHNNLIYGWSEGNSPAKHIYAMDNTGKQVDLGVSADAASYATNYFAGTATVDAKWYMATGQGDAVFKVMDINPLSANYMRYAGQITATGGTFDPWDFAWSQCDSMIYGVSGSQLYKMNPVTGVITKYTATIPGGQGSYGAQWMDVNCDLYISDSQNGNIFRTSLATPPSGTIVFTLRSAGPTGSYNDATINPNYPSDFGDAPASYGQAQHKFNCIGGINTEKTYLGATVDYEPGSVYSTNAKGDDNNYTGITSSNDEDGVSFLIPLHIKRTTYSVTVSAFRMASLVTNPIIYAWIDFNGNGSFEAAEFTSATINLSGTNNYTLNWSGLNCIAMTPGKTYGRFRITTSAITDNIATTNIDERSLAIAFDGEIEDYAVNILGTDYGDAPATLYDSPVSLVYPDLDNDNVPDEPAALWLGTLSKANDGGMICSSICNVAAEADDGDGVDDEDACILPVKFNVGNNTITFVANGNTHGQTGYYGMWIDWDDNGFDNTSVEFYNGSFTVGSPVTINRVVTAPLATATHMYIRIRVAATPLTYADHNTELMNSETEDYFKGIGILPVLFSSFDAAKQGKNNTLLNWKTTAEDAGALFNVQHSNDGISWEKIAAVNGQDTGNIPKVYTYTHANIPKGFHYYRLQYVNPASQSFYSLVKKVQIGNDEVIKFYPNPVRDRLYISLKNLSATNELNIYTIDGQMVLFQKNIKNQTEIDVSALTAGVYLVKLLNNANEPAYFKIVKY